MESEEERRSRAALVVAGERWPPGGLCAPAGVEALSLERAAARLAQVRCDLVALHAAAAVDDPALAAALGAELDEVREGRGLHRGVGTCGRGQGW